MTFQRTAARTMDALDNGPTEQVDHNCFVLPPHATDWDPFILLSDDRFSTVGFDWHPHRGFQTLTLVLDGRLEHRDNAGGYGVLGPGDAQFMVAGRYAMHYELAHERKPVHTLQLWLNLPPELKLGETVYRDLPVSAAPLLEEHGARARLYVGSHASVKSLDPADFPVPFTLVDVEVAAGQRFVHEIPGEHAVVAYALSGAAGIGQDRRALRAGQVAWFAAGEAGPSDLSLFASEDTRLVLWSAAPLLAPVAIRGPFVMTTQLELAQAFSEYRAGRFGLVPGRPVSPGH